MTAAYNCEFGQKQPVFLPDNTTRSFDVICKSIVFTDGSKWENKNNSIYTQTDYPYGVKDLITETTNFSLLIAFTDSEKCKDEKNKFWQKHNKKDVEIQLEYLRSKQKYADAELAKNIESTIKRFEEILSAERKANNDFSNDEKDVFNNFSNIESELKKAEKKYNERKLNNKKKTIAVISAFLSVVAIFIIIFVVVIIPHKNNKAYNIAVEFVNNSQYDEALAIFTKLKNYENSQDYVTYINARNLEQESIVSAYELYKTLPDVFLETKSRMAIIEQFLPYTGTYSYSSGSVLNSNLYLYGIPDINIDFVIYNDDDIQLLCDGTAYEITESDNSNFDYKFDNENYISENELYYDSSITIMNQTETNIAIFKK